MVFAAASASERAALESLWRQLRWRNEQITLFALAWAANNLTMVCAGLYLLYGLLLVTDDAAQAGERATAAFRHSITMAYLKSSALVLLIKDPGMALVIACLPRQANIRSARMRRVVAKLGGTYASYES